MYTVYTYCHEYTDTRTHIRLYIYICVQVYMYIYRYTHYRCISLYIDSQLHPSVSRHFSLPGSLAAPSVIQHLGCQTCATALSFKMLRGIQSISEIFRANEIPLHGQPWLTDGVSSLFHSFGMLSRPKLQQCNMQRSQSTAWERCYSPIPQPAAVRLFVWSWNSQLSKIAVL